MGSRGWDAVPHAGALVAGFVLFRIRLDLPVLDLPGELVYLVVMMMAPVVGAWVVLAAQRRRGVADRQQVLGPYLWWAAGGVLVVLGFYLAFISLRNPEGFVVRDTASQILWWDVVISTFLAATFVVPVLVPLLRLIMWVVRPPARRRG